MRYPWLYRRPVFRTNVGPFGLGIVLGLVGIAVRGQRLPDCRRLAIFRDYE
jgi:hypothetical protein